MNKDITILDNGKILLSSNITNKIIKLTSNIAWIKKENIYINRENEINKYLFTSILDEIRKRPYTKLKNMYIKDYDSKLVSEFEELINKFINWEKSIKADYIVLDKNDAKEICEEKINCINQMIEYATKIDTLEYYLNYKADLYDALKSLEIDLNYCLSKEEINKYIEKVNIELNNDNLDKAKELIINIQKIILKEWTKFTTDINNYKLGEDFNFLCHSTNSTNFNGDFKSNYISCSLFNKNIHFPFNSGFGFILAPINIVGASNKDMYVNNYTNNVENLQSYTSVPLIYHPKRIIELCEKEQNNNNDNLKIYNEIVIQGFNPIAIFSLTDGSKSLDSNYNSACLLQKKFPDLKLINIDLLEYSKGKILEQYQLKLLDKLEKTQPNIKLYDTSNNYIDKFELFFNKFHDIKLNDNYTENDIINIYKLNVRLLDNNLTQDKLFNKDFTKEEIKYVLRKNSNYNIDKILTGNFESDIYFYTLATNLKNCKKDLDEYFPGLNYFVKILNTFNIESDAIMEIKNLNSINFLTISKHLLNSSKNKLSSHKFKK